MSLDVYLKGKVITQQCQCSVCGNLHNHSFREELFEATITHNLNEMAEEAGIYQYLWRPEELNVTRAAQLIDPLLKGLGNLKSNPDHYKEFNPKNGWGTYEILVEFVSNYLDACMEHPEALVEVSR
jgi:hypothetical protein